jgi:hypothetical protein
MKTTFFKIATLSFLLGLTTTTFALTPGGNPETTKLTWLSKFYKIEVHGNVRLHLLQGEKNAVEMRGTYFDHNALLQVDNGVLRITCYRTECLDVWVTVYDLSAIAAYDNVKLDTYGKLSVIELDVELFNKAKASLNLDCFSTHIKLNDSALADLSGYAMEGNLEVNYASTLSSSNFVADQVSRKRLAPVQQAPVRYNAQIENDDLFKGEQLTVVNTH